MTSVVEHFTEIARATRNKVAEEHKQAIGIVGAGGIVDGAHLPAYALAGLTVVGITDTNLERAREVAARHHIPKVYESAADLLEDPDVVVVDIAVPLEQQPPIFKAALAAGKHILAQKPFAETPEVAKELADEAAASGLVAAVNQQMRFDEGVAAAHEMVNRGLIGEVTSFSITVNITTEWEQWEWAKTMPKLEIMVHSIHYHDLLRWFMGEPTSVYAIAGRTPGQFPVGETRTLSTYTFATGASAVIHVNHVNHGGDNTAEFRIDGSQGAIRGTIGLLYDYPDGRPDTVELNSKVLPTDGWVPYAVTQRWFPHAFIGTMGSVLEGIATGGKPRSSVADNVKTVELVAHLYRSIQEQRVVHLL